jgi:uncharacterized protein (TIGR02231 family)
MSTFKFLLALAVSILVFQNQSKALTGDIQKVKLFYNAAEINRTAKFSFQKGKNSIVVSGLEDQIDESTLSVKGKGNYMILSVNLRKNHLEATQLTAKSLEKLTDSIRILQSGMRDCQDKITILDHEWTTLIANQKINQGDRLFTINDLKSLSDYSRIRMEDILRKKREQEDSKQKQQIRLSILQKQLNEEKAKLVKLNSEVVVEIEAKEQGQGILDIKYVTYSAGWFPHYNIRSMGVSQKIDFQMQAKVFQSTGENWKNINIELLSQNVNLANTKPELNPWRINFYEPYIYQQNRAKAYGAAPSSAKENGDFGIEESAVLQNAADLAEVVQIQNNQLNTAFDLAQKVDVESDGKEHTLQLKNTSVDAAYFYYAVPKLDANAFLMAGVSALDVSGMVPANANIFFEDTYVGKTYFNPLVAGDTVSISFGRDESLQINRKLLTENSEKKVIGTNKKESFIYELSFKNTKQKAIGIKIEDQYPVAINNEILVELIESSGAEIYSTNGLLTWRLSVNANESKKIRFGYQVKYPKQKRIQL